MVFSFSPASDLVKVSVKVFSKGSELWNALLCLGKESPKGPSVCWGGGRGGKETCLNIISLLLPFKDFSTNFLKIFSEKTEFATDWQFPDCFFRQGSSSESHNCISVWSVLHRGLLTTALSDFLVATYHVYVLLSKTHIGGKCDKIVPQICETKKKNIQSNIFFVYYSGVP